MNKSLEELLERLGKLQKDWDSYGADPIDPRAIVAAKSVINSLCVVPTVNGGVQIEVHNSAGHLEIEIDKFGKIIDVGDLTSSVQDLRQCLYDEAWQHAACLSIAEGLPGWQNCTNESVAMKAVKKLRQQYEDLAKSNGQNT